MIDIKKIIPNTRIIYFVVVIGLAIFWNHTFLFDNNFGIFDWSKELYYFTYLKHSLIEFRVLPTSFLSIPNTIAWFPTLSQTVSFIGNPEVMYFSPAVIFLPFLSVASFIRVSFMLHVIIGIWGIYRLGKYFKFDSISIVLLSCLTIFNPWMMQHIAIGYTPCLTFYYVPFIIYSLVSKYKLSNLVISSIFSAFIIYEGGLHVFDWLNMAIVVGVILAYLIFRNARMFYKVGLYYLLTIVLIFPKLLVSAIAFEGYNTIINSSYGSLHDIFGLLIDTKASLYNLSAAYNIYGVAIYDGTLAMSKYFFVVIIVSLLMVAYLYLKKRNRQQIKTILYLFLAMISFTMLGWRGIWSFFASKMLLLTAEKYPYRFLFISLLFFLFFIIYEVNCFRSKIKYFLLLLLLPLIIIMYQRNDYFSHIATSKTMQDYSSSIVNYRSFALKDYYNTSITYLVGDVTKKPDHVSPKIVEIKNINSREITIPWLKNANDFDFESEDNVTLHQQKEGLVVNFRNDKNSLKIKAKDCHYKTSFLLSIIIYLILIGVLKREVLIKFSRKLVHITRGKYED